MRGRAAALTLAAAGGACLPAVLFGVQAPATVAQGVTLGPTTPTTTLPVAPTPTRHYVSLTAKLKIKPQGGAYVGTGPVTGAPFGSGRFTSRSVVTRRVPLRTATTLTAVYSGGSVTFRGNGEQTGSVFKATVNVSAGTGKFRGIKGYALHVTDTNRNGGDTLRMTGSVTFAAATP
jgi:hypothetical protein